MTISLALVIGVAAATPSAQQVLRTGPPPEVRALFDAFTEAINSGSAETWEAFVQARFVPALLQKSTPQERAAMYQQLANDFGTIEIESHQRALMFQKQLVQLPVQFQEIAKACHVVIRISLLSLVLQRPEER